VTAADRTIAVSAREDRMSLKAFHVIFMSAAVLLAVGLGLWSLDQRAQGRPGAWLAYAIASFAVALGLVVYEAWFLRKTRQVSSW
jgi:hypothetical protein